MRIAWMSCGLILIKPLIWLLLTRPMVLALMDKRNVFAKTQSITGSNMNEKNGIKIPPPHEYFVELERVSKNQIIWGANYFVENLTKGTKGWVVWYKGQQGLTMSDCELAYSSFDCPTRVVTINRAELAKQKTIHPTEKPIKLYKWLLLNYAKEGDKIIDTHLGSGSIAIACSDANFDLTGIELDPDYYKSAKLRIIEHQKQLCLF